MAAGDDRRGVKRWSMKQLLTDAMAAAAALAAYRAEPLGWTAFSVHLSWDSTRGKKEARFPPGGWKANGGFAEDGWNGACIDTGRSKLTVVDFDGARGLAMAERIREALPPFVTREAVTGSGGRRCRLRSQPRPRSGRRRTATTAGCAASWRWLTRRRSS